MAAKEKKFEEEIKDLETLVNQIDSGELTLEESISAFERGVALTDLEVAGADLEEAFLALTARRPAGS